MDKCSVAELPLVCIGMMHGDLEIAKMCAHDDILDPLRWGTVLMCGFYDWLQRSFPHWDPATRIHTCKHLRHRLNDLAEQLDTLDAGCSPAVILPYNISIADHRYLSQCSPISWHDLWEDKLVYADAIPPIETVTSIDVSKTWQRARARLNALRKK